MLVGIRELFRKGSSKSILASSLAGSIATCLLKRKLEGFWCKLCQSRVMGE